MCIRFRVMKNWEIAIDSMCVRVPKIQAKKRNKKSKIVIEFCANKTKTTIT